MKDGEIIIPQVFYSIKLDTPHSPKVGILFSIVKEFSGVSNGTISLVHSQTGNNVKQQGEEITK